jgi:hypothetical protein
MKHESLLLLGLGAFFGLTAVVYWLWSGEQAGSVMLVASCGLGFLPGSYYLWWSRRMHARPSDRDSTIAEGAGYVATFPGSSIWPFILGMGAFCIGLALVFGIWLAVPALGLIIWALLGGVVESRHGDHSAISSETTSGTPHH